MKNILIVLTLFVFSFVANASLLLEPHVGYLVTGGQASFNNKKTTFSGPVYGAKVGLQYLGAMGGMAYNHSSVKVKQTNLTTTVETKFDASTNDLGVFLGFNAPILVRAWVAYYLSSKSTDEYDNYYKGATTELGIGFTPLPLLSLNIIYQMASYDKQYVASTKTESTLTTKYEPKSVLVSVSLPFHLF